MHLFISLIHVFVCFVLILVILLQAGKGGGLSDFGGSVTHSQKLFGTETNSFLTRATTACAIVFILTCLVLGLMTSRQGKSLMQGAALKPFFDTQNPIEGKESSTPGGGELAPAAPAEPQAKPETPQPASDAPTASEKSSGT